MKAKLLTMVIILAAAVLTGCQHNSPSSQQMPAMTNSNSGQNPGVTNNLANTNNPATRNP